MPPQWILCLRHGEKPAKENGDEPEGLSTPGRHRAELLATALAPGGKLLPAGAPSPSHVFVPGYASNTGANTTKSHRSYLTVEPLLANLGRLGHQVDLVSRNERDHVGELATGILESGPLVVVCWEHDALAAWLQRFAGMGHVVEPEDEPLPCEWDGKVFDAIWRLTRVTDKPTYALSIERQGLPVADEAVFDRDGRAVGYVNREAGTFRA